VPEYRVPLGGKTYTIESERELTPTEQRQEVLKYLGQPATSRTTQFLEAVRGKVSPPIEAALRAGLGLEPETAASVAEFINPIQPTLGGTIGQLAEIGTSVAFPPKLGFRLLPSIGRGFIRAIAPTIPAVTGATLAEEDPFAAGLTTAIGGVVPEVLRGAVAGGVGVVRRFTRPRETRRLIEHDIADTVGEIRSARTGDPVLPTKTTPPDPLPNEPMPDYIKRLDEWARTLRKSKEGFVARDLEELGLGVEKRRRAVSIEFGETERSLLNTQIAEAKRSGRMGDMSAMYQLLTDIDHLKKVRDMAYQSGQGGKAIFEHPSKEVAALQKEVLQWFRDEINKAVEVVNSTTNSVIKRQAQGRITRFEQEIPLLEAYGKDRAGRLVQTFAQATRDPGSMTAIGKPLRDEANQIESAIMTSLLRYDPNLAAEWVENNLMFRQSRVVLDLLSKETGIFRGKGRKTILDTEKAEQWLRDNIEEVEGSGLIGLVQAINPESVSARTARFPIPDLREYLGRGNISFRIPLGESLGLPGRAQAQPLTPRLPSPLPAQLGLMQTLQSLQREE
jgi:hypothetical protein